MLTDWLWTVTVGLERALSAQAECFVCKGDCFVVVESSRVRPCPNPLHTHLPLLGRYRIVSELAQGTFSTVFLLQQSESKRLLAAKVMPRKLGVILENDFTTSHSLVHNYFLGHGHACTLLIQEYMQPLPDMRVLDWSGRLDMLRRMLEDVGWCLQTLHAKGFVHADVKPSNVMYRGGYSVPFALIDYGNAIASTEINNGNEIVSPRYRAPELLSVSPANIITNPSDQIITSAVDIWALGISIVEIISGQHPFQYIPQTELLKSINDTLDVNRAQVRLQLMHWTDINDSPFIDLLERMLSLKVKDRISASDLLCHPFLNRRTVP